MMSQEMKTTFPHLTDELTVCKSMACGLFERERIMTMNQASNRKNVNVIRSRVISLLFLMTLFAPSVFGQLNLWDRPQGLPDLDNRAGSVAPTAAQLSKVQSLGARAEWNQFGTVQTMLKYGGFLSTGLSGDPVSAAREWIRANKELFRLSDQCVNNLELLSDGTMPYSAA